MSIMTHLPSLCLFFSHRDTQKLLILWHWVSLTSFNAYLKDKTLGENTENERKKYRVDLLGKMT